MLAVPAQRNCQKSSVAVTSSGNIADDSMAVKTGTSQACPHVSGVAAQYLESNPAASPQEVRPFLLMCLATTWALPLLHFHLHC